MAATVRVTVEDKVGTLALDNVTTRNALGVRTVDEIPKALDVLERTTA
jgi:enoyl-CoA hydratase/carnithine racemase